MSRSLSTPPRIESAVARDGYRFFVRVWDPAVGRCAEEAVRAEEAADTECASASVMPRVFFLHGIISHGGWYEGTCARMAAAGCEVHFLDRRGAGLNAAARGDVESFHTWISDVADYVGANAADQRPAILAGISWGGKLALAIVKAHPGLAAGLALICPGIFSRFGSRWLERAAVAVASRTPARTLRVAIPLQDPRLFTGDPAWQRSIARDPLVLRRITLRAARANLELSDFVRDATVETPLLLLLAGDDQIIDNAASRDFVAGTAARDKRIVEYAGAPHTLEFGHDPHRHVDDFIAWCERIKVGTLENMQISGKEICPAKVG